MSYTEDLNYALRTDKEKAANPKPVQPLSMKHIVYGVFLGMWAFSITAGAVYYVLTH